MIVNAYLVSYNTVVYVLRGIVYRCNKGLDNMSNVKDDNYAKFLKLLLDSERLDKVMENDDAGRLDNRASEEVRDDESCDGPSNSGFGMGT